MPFVAETDLDPVEPTAPPAPGGRFVTAADLDPEPIGLGRAAVQGGIRGAVDMAAGLAGSPVGAPLRLAAAAIGRDPSVLADPSTAGQRARQIFEKIAAPYLAPTGTVGEAIVSGGARGIVGALPTLGVGSASAPLTLAASGAGGAVSEGATAAGLDPRVAAGLGIATSIGISTAPTTLGAVARGRALPGLDRGRESAEIAAAAQLRGAIGKDAVDDAVALLDDEIALGSVPGQARTSQVLMDRAPGVVGLEGAQARRFPALQSAAARRLQQNEPAVNAAMDDIQVGAAGDLAPSWQAARDASAARVRAAYDAVDPSAVGAIQTAGLKAVASRMAAEAGDELRGKLPGEVAMIGRYGDAIDFPALQRLRTSLSDTARELSRTKPGSADLRYAQQLKAAVDDELGRLADAGVSAAPALKAAIGARAEHGRLYDIRHPSVKALEGNERASAVVDAIASGSTKRPTEEARRVLDAVGRGTDGHEGLKRLWMDNALGGRAIWNAKHENSIAWLRKNEAASREILGDEAHATAIRLLERARQLQYGHVGKRGSALGTGSNLPDSDELADAATGVLGFLIKGKPGAAASVAAGKAWDWLVTRTTSDQRAEILNEALLDPKRARELLTTVTPERLERWKRGMESNIGRQGVAAAGRQE